MSSSSSVEEGHHIREICITIRRILSQIDSDINNRLFYLRLPLLVLKRINKEVTTPRPIKDWDLQLLNYLMYVRLSH